MFGIKRTKRTKVDYELDTVDDVHLSYPWVSFLVQAIYIYSYMFTLQKKGLAGTPYKNQGRLIFQALDIYGQMLS